MSKSTCQSRLPLSATTTPDFDIQNSMDMNSENRRQSSLNDKRIHNVNYVRHVLRRFFGGYNKKYTSPTIYDDISYEQSPTTNKLSENLTSPILIHPNLQYDKNTKFSGMKKMKRFLFIRFKFLGELLLDWFLIHFEGRCENSTLIKQIILKCCTCLISLGVLRVENEQQNDLFQVRKKISIFGFSYIHKGNRIDRLCSNWLFSCSIMNIYDLSFNNRKIKISLNME